MNDSAIKHLDVVLLLLREQRKEINRIKKEPHKRIGLCTVQLTVDEKTERIQQAQNQYKRQIASVYNHLNAELEADGRESLTNPFI